MCFLLESRTAQGSWVEAFVDIMKAGGTYRMCGPELTHVVSKVCNHSYNTPIFKKSHANTSKSDLSLPLCVCFFARAESKSMVILHAFDLHLIFFQTSHSTPFEIRHNLSIRWRQGVLNGIPGEFRTSAVTGAAHTATSCTTVDRPHLERPICVRCITIVDFILKYVLILKT